MKKYLLKFEKFFFLFRSYGINFAVHGDAAVYMWGVRKKIRYLDIIIDFNDENIHRFVRLMRNMGMKIKEDLNYKILPDFLKNREDSDIEYITFYHKRIFPWRFRLWIKDELKNYRCVEKRLGNLKIPVVSIEDLLNFKKSRICLKELQDFHFMKDILQGIL